MKGFIADSLNTSRPSEVFEVFTTGCHNNEEVNYVLL